MTMRRRGTPKGFRDVSQATSVQRAAARGRMIVAVVGIDRYRGWPSLANAVSDACGARSLFLHLGFEELVPPLLDEAATGAAVRALVADDLAKLNSEDCLVVFYAGHGGTQVHKQDTTEFKTGYLIPVDADDHKASTWLELDTWLRSISVLPPRHILVILDACHSGMALSPTIRWRGEVAGKPPLEALQSRRSRRVITSALDDERAVDSGPVPGHSLFTGCLIEALRGGVSGYGGVVTGSQIAVWVQNRVQSYPNVKQTPDFGAFDHDDRGEMLIPLRHDVDFHRADNADRKTRPTPGTSAPVPGAQTPPLEISPAHAFSLPSKQFRSRTNKALRELWSDYELLMIVSPLLIVIGAILIMNLI